METKRIADDEEGVLVTPYRDWIKFGIDTAFLCPNDSARAGITTSSAVHREVIPVTSDDRLEILRILPVTTEFLIDHRRCRDGFFLLYLPCHDGWLFCPKCGTYYLFDLWKGAIYAEVVGGLK